MSKNSVLILLISLGQSIYAGDHDRKKTTKKYPSYNKRVKQIKKSVARQMIIADAVGSERVFERNPRSYWLLRINQNLMNGTIPVESPELREQIHQLRHPTSYDSAASDSSVGVKVVPAPELVQLDPVPVSMESVSAAQTPVPAPSLCSCCVIL